MACLQVTPDFCLGYRSVFLDPLLGFSHLLEWLADLGGHSTSAVPFLTKDAAQEQQRVRREGRGSEPLALGASPPSLPPTCSITQKLYEPHLWAFREASLCGHE